MIKHIELPRMTDGLLAPPGGSAKKSGKRLREGGAVSSPNFSPKVQQLASMDMALPSPCPPSPLAKSSSCSVERADQVGGRVRTDSESGFLLDRGFQVPTFVV